MITDDYLPCNASDQNTEKLVTKKTQSIYRRARYLKARLQKGFLSRKTSQRVRGILKDYPDIGEEIENLVQNIGADAWCRTGVLTFDGNTC